MQDWPREIFVGDNNELLLLGVGELSCFISLFIKEWKHVTLKMVQPKVEGVELHFGGTSSTDNV